MNALRPFGEKLPPGADSPTTGRVLESEGPAIGNIVLGPVTGNYGVRDALLRGPQGWYRGPTVEGTDTYTAFLTLPFSGWSVGQPIPAGEVLRASNRTAFILVGGVLASLLLAIGLAYLLGKRVTAPIVEAARSWPKAQAGVGARLSWSGCLRSALPSSRPSSRSPRLRMRIPNSKCADLRQRPGNPTTGRLGPTARHVSAPIRVHP